MYYSIKATGMQDVSEIVLLAEKFMDCDCIDKSSQEESIEILKRLSVALNYIYIGEVSGHKNYVTSALTDWSSMLYEIMEWK